MADQSQARREFAAQFERALADTAGGAKKSAKQGDRDYQQLSAYIRALKDPGAIDACLTEYLRLYPKYAPSDPRSRFAFILLVKRRIDVAPSGGAELKALGDQLQQPGKRPSALWTRFHGLPPAEQQEITAALAAKGKKAAGPVTLLDLLRDEYLRQKQVAAATNADLRAFDPAPDPAVKAELDAQIDNVQQAWNRSLLGNEEQTRLLLHLALDFFRGYLIGFSRQGVLTLFQVIKYLQDRV